MQDQGDNEQPPKVDVVPKDEDTENMFKRAAKVNLSREDPNDSSFSVDGVEEFPKDEEVVLESEVRLGNEEVMTGGKVEESVQEEESVELKMEEAGKAYKKALDEAQDLAAEVGAQLHDEKYKVAMKLGYADFVEKFPEEAKKIADKEGDEYLQELLEEREFEAKMEDLDGLQELLESGEISEDKFIEGFAKVLGEDPEKAKEACKKFLEGNESASIKEAMEKLERGELPIPESIEDEELRRTIKEELGEEETEEEEISPEIDMKKVKEKAKWVYETARKTQRSMQGSSGLRMEMAQWIAGEDGDIVDAAEKLDGKLRDFGLSSWADLNTDLYYRNYDGLVRMVQENPEEGKLIAREVKKQFKNLMLKRFGAYGLIEGIFEFKDALKNLKDLIIKSMYQAIMEETQRT